MTWAVNALAPFLLTSLLLDTVKERIVNVGSMALASSMDFNNLHQVIIATELHAFSDNIACGLSCCHEQVDSQCGSH